MNTTKKIASFEGCPKRQEQIIVQKASNNMLLFNMDDGSYYALNEVSNRVWATRVVFLSQHTAQNCLLIARESRLTRKELRGP